MTLEKFKEIIKLIQEDDKDSMEQYRLYIQPEMKDKLNQVITLLFEEILGEHCYDMLTWWIYDTSPKFLYDSKTKEIIEDLATVEAIYDYIERNKNIKDATVN